ncbi:hypothetical protein HanPI659440_Chr17g0700761 [Helianthus annuus]|nr:hypothetical protein HanPI659440_Chr17g0700761 [Helianthus annuus]
MTRASSSITTVGNLLPSPSLIRFMETHFRINCVQVLYCFFAGRYRLR